ncbi:hypothetical protein ACIOJD_13720 [Streptomyces sp. NPDC088116]|uniref:hypothetical protein n=1 Tax=Streptomyces sp. NPDC088116 TaxID=3365825 RepID=UPI0037FA6DB0
MSEPWPRHAIVKFAGTVVDGFRDPAYGLLDCAARVDGKLRETVIVLLDEEDKDTAGTHVAARGEEAQAEELRRVGAELAALREKIGRLVGTAPPARECG